MLFVVSAWGPSLVPECLQRAVPQSLAVRLEVLVLGLVSELEKESELALERELVPVWASVLNQWLALTLARLRTRL